MLQGSVPLNFLFSNNFEYYLDFDFLNNQVVVMETASQTVYFRIPEDRINFNNKAGYKDSEMIS